MYNYSDMACAPLTDIPAINRSVSGSVVSIRCPTTLHLFYHVGYPMIL